jgi:hypothetical protein
MLGFQQVYQGPPLQFDLDFELYEHALMYSLNGHIYIRNLTTKTVI